MTEVPAGARLTPARRRVLDELVDALLDADAARCAAELDRLRERTPRIHWWVCELLAAGREPSRYLQTLFERVGSAARQSGPGGEITLPAGTRLGAWRVIRSAGRGGMGSVYQAERADGAFEMIVAIKLIRLSRAALDEQLQAERRLLARLDHRNIARLIDGGATEGGEAYLVMEWIEGRDLDEFVAEVVLTLDVRLDLFEQIAEAVAHAHQRRVVHGDLKPANIRVTESGQVRLVDFGVARLIMEGDVAADNPVKALTPAFCAPEQLAGDITSTQSDVWSLGVILQWLLGGGIRDKQPDGTDPADLPPDLPRRKDMLAILGRACVEDPEGRYAGVMQLLEDVRRYRCQMPVDAAKATRRYVFARFVQRHRLSVGLGVAASVTLCLAVVIALWQARVATLERDRATEEAARALSAEQQAGQLAGELQQVVDFQSDQLSSINVSGMGAGLRRAITDKRRAVLEETAVDDKAVERGLHELELSLEGVNFTDLALAALDDHLFAQTLGAINAQFGEQPLVRARLMQTMATTMRNLGLRDQIEAPQREALEIRRRLLGSDHPDTLDSIKRMGYLYGRLGRHEQQELLYEEAIAGYRRVLGDLHPSTLNAIGNMGTYRLEQGRLGQAEKYLRESLEGRREVLGDDHPDTLISISNMGALLLRQERVEEAESFYRQVVDGRRRQLGDDHPSTLSALNNLGFLLREDGRPKQAMPYYREALEGRRRVLGNDHPETLRSVNNMGFLLKSMGRLAQARPYAFEAMENARDTLGSSHPSTLVFMHNAGALLQSMGRYEEAAQLAAETVRLGRTALPHGHWHTGVFLTEHGQALVALGRFGEAEQSMLKAHEIYMAALGAGHERTGEIAEHIAELYDSWHGVDPDRGYDRKAVQWRRDSADRSAR